MRNEKFEKFIAVPKNIISQSKKIILDFIFSKQFFIDKFLPKPIIKDNTFIVWEPCSKSHSEVVPGYVKYLIDLGYDVSVLVDPDRIKEGLFVRFNSPNVHINKISQSAIRNFFRYGDLSNIKGIIVTTVGKLCKNMKDYDGIYDGFNKTIELSKIHFVEHDIKETVDNGTWKKDLITLRETDYKNTESVVVNPHYFGNTKITQKNLDITNFVTVGVIKPRKKDNGNIINAVMELHNKGITNFKITVIGKGEIKNIPEEIRKYFDIKGRLNFDKMYNEIEKADFMLTSYNETHTRYITTGTSGNFQLIYGFLKPCIIIESFAKINRFNNDNSIIYKEPKDYSQALEKAINLSQEEYKLMQNNLKETVKEFYNESLNNLKGAING